MATIEKVLKLKVEDYRLRVEEAGHQSAVFSAEICCIKSGALYAFSRDDLDKVLRDNRIALSDHGWPVKADAFIRRIASEWLDDDSPILPVVRKAFGDSADS
jgi:hypothetical protein